MTKANRIHQSVFPLALSALIQMIIAVSLGACASERIQGLKDRGEIVYPQSRSAKTREQQCREFGRYCEQGRNSQ
jgi:hypothetical protein